MPARLARGVCCVLELNRFDKNSGRARLKAPGVPRRRANGCMVGHEQQQAARRIPRESGLSCAANWIKSTP